MMNKYIDIINKNLDKYLEIVFPEKLFQSMRYTVLLPGKRLRPIMCLETCRLFGGEITNAIPTACAIEMLHAQTLIHDDLPCMDNDNYRRGQLTNHKVFGEATAVLAGDALLTFAPQVITKYSKNLGSEKIIRLLEEYFKYAGAYGVIAGQVVDIESEKTPPENPQEVLKYIHTHKTADLFKLSMRTGAIIADANEKQLNCITEFAQKLGFAFQIADDILDETSTFEELGKTLGKDKEAGKLTYTSLYNIEESKLYLNDLINECMCILKNSNIKSEIFEQILTKIKK